MGNKMFNLPYIGIDDARAMKELTLKLVEDISEGDILYYAPILRRDDLHATNAQRLRLAGFLKAVTSLGKGYRIVTSLEDIADFGGIVCSTDYYAARVLKHLGYPKDIKIAGFDNISLLKSLDSCVLTVEYSTARIAEECINYILGRPFTAEIEHTLIWNTVT